MALWSAIYGKIWPLLRREPVPQQPCCRMTKMTISPDSMTKMTNARHPLTKWQNCRITTMTTMIISLIIIYLKTNTQTLMLDSILWLNLSKTLECVFASSTVHCNDMGTHQQLLPIAWAISGTFGVGLGCIKFILWTSCIWDSFLPGCITRMCLHLFIHLFILFCIDLIWIRPDWSYFACVSIFDNFYFCGEQQILGAMHGAHSGGFNGQSWDLMADREDFDFVCSSILIFDCFDWCL